MMLCPGIAAPASCQPSAHYHDTPARPPSSVTFASDHLSAADVVLQNDASYHFPPRHVSDIPTCATYCIPCRSSCNEIYTSSIHHTRVSSRYLSSSLRQPLAVNTHNSRCLQFRAKYTRVQTSSLVLAGPLFSLHRPPPSLFIVRRNFSPSELGSRLRYRFMAHARIDARSSNLSAQSRHVPRSLLHPSKLVQS